MELGLPLLKHPPCLSVLSLSLHYPGALAPRLPEASLLYSAVSCFFVTFLWSL